MPSTVAKTFTSKVAGDLHVYWSTYGL